MILNMLIEHIIFGYLGFYANSRVSCDNRNSCLEPAFLL